jgi:hypothetical protein
LVERVSCKDDVAGSTPVTGSLSAVVATLALMKACRGCGEVLTKPSQQLYCSVKCMQALRRRELLRQWLETGVGRADSHKGHYVRDHIEQEQGGRCALCGQTRTWNGLGLVLVLDHIDGDSSNNRRENLRLVCPNCDSQLETYKMRNRGGGRYSRRVRYAEGQSY